MTTEWISDEAFAVIRLWAYLELAELVVRGGSQNERIRGFNASMKMKRVTVLCG